MLKTTLERRIDALDVPRVLLADLAQVGPNDVTAWLKGRPVSEHRRVALENALADVESAHSYVQLVIENDGVPPALTVENVRALTAIRTDSERMTQSAQV